MSMNKFDRKQSTTWIFPQEISTHSRKIKWLHMNSLRTNTLKSFKKIENNHLCFANLRLEVDEKLTSYNKNLCCKYKEGKKEKERKEKAFDLSFILSAGLIYEAIKINRIYRVFLCFQFTWSNEHERLKLISIGRPAYCKILLENWRIFYSFGQI